MTAAIDTLVRHIRYALAIPGADAPETGFYFELIGVDGTEKARELRALIAGYADDMALPASVRTYAQQQLDALPDF